MSQTIKTLLLTSLMSLVMIVSNAQIEDYEYRSPLSNAIIGWNYIELHHKILGQSKNNLNDIRIYHKDSATNKYIEQPFYLDIQSAKFETKVVDFKIINKSNQKDLYAYTFELSNKDAVNKINLIFNNQNYDWKIHLEGSMDNNSWSTIVENYRILSINNAETKFTYSEISIPESKFNFYKISFYSNKKPNLNKAFLSRVNKTQPSLISYPTDGLEFEEDEKLKTTNATIKFKEPIPISQVAFLIGNETDYYRPYTIEGALDSFNTEKGWKYRYQTLYQGTVNSFNKNSFDFDSQIVKRIKITIYNFDSQPLKFDSTSLRGPKYRLITRLEETDNLTLVHGNEKGNKPLYDITYFKDKIPIELNRITLGEAKYFPKLSQEKEPLFKNKWWLWGSMIIVILLLGTFTLKMLREDNTK